jgi:hypothetical protein
MTEADSQDEEDYVHRDAGDDSVGLHDGWREDAARSLDQNLASAADGGGRSNRRHGTLALHGHGRHSLRILLCLCI